MASTRPKRTLVQRVQEDIIDINLYDDIESNTRDKSRWKTIGDITEALAHIFIGATVVLSFAAGFFDLKYLSFISGCCATVSMALLRFSAYCFKESKERTAQVNILLKYLGISPIPDITIESPAEPALRVIKDKDRLSLNEV